MIRFRPMWVWLKAWWEEFRRPKCWFCKKTVERGQSTCEDEECIAMHKTAQMGP